VINLKILINQEKDSATIAHRSKFWGLDGIIVPQFKPEMNDRTPAVGQPDARSHQPNTPKLLGSLWST